MNSQLKIKKQKEFKNVHNITSSEISKTDFALVAFGLQDGTISMWNPLSLNL